jgi:hypothetical protein
MSFGQFDAGSDKSEYNAISFLIEQAMLKMQTVTLVKVIAVHSNGVGITGTVDVQPMVNQMQAGPNGTQTAIAHGTIYGVPFFRLQGGLSAFICDPVDGDIGLCGFAARDISSVKQTRAVANPGSQRTYDWADGLYVGGFINGVPTQYIQALASAGGWKIVTPGDITLESPLTEVTGDLKVDGDTTLEGELSVTGASTFTGAMATAALTSSGVITAAGFSGPGGTSPAGPPGPAGPTGPTGPAFLDVTGPGGFSLTGVTNAAFAGSCTVTGSGTSVTITITGGGGGSITDITGSSFVTISNGTGPTVGVDLSSSFQAAYAATAALAVSALQTVSVQDSITGAGTSGSKLQLVNDSATPGANMVYGTDGSGTKGWQTAGGGSAEPFNITPDTHGSGVPLFAANDEFEESSLDTGGTRFAGATPWAWVNQSTASVTLNAGSLIFSGQINASQNVNFIAQAITTSTTAWRYRAKMAMSFSAAYNNGGFILYESSSGKMMEWGHLNNNGTMLIWVSYMPSFTGGNTAVQYNNTPFSIYGGSQFCAPVYWEIELAAGILYFRYSITGVDGTFTTYYSESVTTHFTTTPDHIGIGGWSQNGSTAIVIQSDWFRQEA